MEKDHSLNKAVISKRDGSSKTKMTVSNINYRSTLTHRKVGYLTVGW